MKKIKIVFLTQELVCGGAEQALFDLICLMDKTKFDISVLAMVGDGAWEEKFRGAGIPVANIFYKRQKGCSPLQYVKHQLYKAKIHRIIQWDSEKLFEMFLPEKADIVVSYSMWGYEAATLACDAKLIKYVHGNVRNNKVFCQMILKTKDRLPEYRRIICVSKESYDSFREVMGIEENVRLYYNPLNSENVRQMADLPVDLPEDVPVICAVGRLAPEKGYDRLIRIHKHILDGGVRHKLVIVGDGPEKEKLQRIIFETDTADSVILAGYQPNPYPYMKRSRCIVCSSFTESLPVISMEALVLGVPIVSAVPSIGEVFGDLVCGIITENDDDSLECGIRKMLCDDRFYLDAQKGAQARSAFFDGKRMVKELENMFFEVMEEDTYENG